MSFEALARCGDGSMLRLLHLVLRALGLQRLSQGGDHGGIEPAADLAREALVHMQRDSSVYDIAALYAVQNVILPHTTREYLIRMLAVHRLRLTRGIGQHLLRAWPTSD